MPAILPLGRTTFADANGTPLAAGSVAFYVPGTTTPKTTWQDSGGTIVNTDPVVLDGAGAASIWGSGSYRQVVQNAAGVTIWDQIVSSGDISAAMLPVVEAATLAAAQAAMGVPSIDQIRNMLVFTPTGATLNGASIAWTNGGNWTVPAGVTRARVQVWGAGGGGGGAANISGAAGSGGCGGGYAEGLFTFTPGQIIAVTSGAGGLAGTTSSNGGAGGTSSVGAIISATGGGGGYVALGGSPSTGLGVGGVGIGGSFQMAGQIAALGVLLPGGGSNYIMGYGGSSYASSYGALIIVAASNGPVIGNAGYSPGQGASGGFYGAIGGVGANGLIIVEY